MKKITKDNKGITLIALIVTIVVMLILISVTTYTGIETYKTSQMNKFVTQMQLLQAKVDDLVSTKTAEELDNMGLLNVTTQEQINAIANAFKQEEITTADTSKYKVLTKDQVLNILDVEDVQNDILVNFETREIVDVVGIEYEGTTYYTQYKLPGGQTIINNSSGPDRELLGFNAEIDSEIYNSLTIVIDGLNATITISDIQITNGTLNYKEENDTYWKTITNYTETNKSYNVVISKSGNYIFRFEDNTNSENYTEKAIEIRLTNKPKTELEIQEYNYALTSENWAYTTKNNLNYVWIPRFAYNVNNNIKFIKGNSNIATDNSYVDDIWNIHDKFTTDNNVELTGVWISVKAEEVNQSGLNMLSLLNDTSREVLVEI